MVGDAVRAVISPGELAEVLAEKTALAALQRAKPVLIAAQTAAAAQTDPSDAKALADKVTAAGRAVRMLEAATYAGIYAERFAKFSAVVMPFPLEIRAAHGRTCTCAN